MEKTRTYGNRIKTEDKDKFVAVVKGSAVYKRLSSFEQVRDSKYSVIRQHRLVEVAQKDSYKTELSDEKIKSITESEDYCGWYKNGDVYVIDADLGISSQKTQDERPGLTHLIFLIKNNMIKTIYVLDQTRLFRDAELVEVVPFAKLCKDHNIEIVLGG